MTNTIHAISAAERLDSRGKPTVQVSVTTSQGTFTALVPSGASKGDYEAIELRDSANTSRYHGNGVLGAIRNVTDIIGPELRSKHFTLPEDVAAIDRFMIELDGTEDKSRLGANAILGVSMACWRAAAAEKKLPLYDMIRQYAETSEPFVMPVPFFNVLNGGVHSGNTMPFQEFMVALAGAESVTEAVRMGSEVYWALKGVIRDKYGGAAIGVGDEGGFAPPITHPYEALDLLVTAVDNCGYTGKVKFAIDPASSEFFDESDGSYDMAFKQSTPTTEGGTARMGREDLASVYRKLIKDYPIVLLEDPFAQDDWQSWTEFNKDCRIELVGDDLLATNKKRIDIAEEKKACNALLLKINQIGSVTEAIEAARQAFGNGWSVFVSHRSGETTDDFIADLTVGLRTGHLKAGSPCRGERVAKYNRLMDIETELEQQGRKYEFAGDQFRRAFTM